LQIFLFLGDDLLEFHQAVVSTLRDADDMPIPLDPAPMISHTNAHSMMMPPMMNDELGRISDVVNTDQPLDPEDELDPGLRINFLFHF
jgi:RIMS-binding protein 2